MASKFFGPLSIWHTVSSDIYNQAHKLETENTLARTPMGNWALKTRMLAVSQRGNIYFLCILHGKKQVRSDNDAPELDIQEQIRTFWDHSEGFFLSSLDFGAFRLFS